ALGADQCLCEPERARARPRGDRADRAGARRLRPPLRRLCRRGRLYGAVALLGEALSDRLAARPGPAARGHRAVRAQRHAWPVGPAHGALARAAVVAMSEAPATREALLETRGLCRNFGALAAARDIDFRLVAG